MLSAFIVVFREGFESFLIVGVILAYLRRMGQERLVPAMYWGIAASVLASTGLGYMLSRGVNESLWEGVLGVVTILLVGSLVVHMWKAGPQIKRDMENKLSRISARSSRLAFAGVFFFTVVMITKEGMETVLMLFQIHDSKIVTGIALGVLGTVAISWMWVHVGHLINVKRFFQVTAIFLMLFMVQIGIYSFHEFSEARVLGPRSEALHDATEPFSPDGIYGRWFSLIAVGACAVWLGAAKVSDSLKKGKAPSDRLVNGNRAISL